MNTRRSTGSIKTSKRGMRCIYTAPLTTKTITPELHAINAKICRLVEQHPCMYDRSNPSYMRKGHIERAWEDISKEMNDNVDNCKERFRNIRTSFARSINVQRGSNRVKPYYLSAELEFLKKHITPGVPVPVKGRRSRDGNRRGDDNDDFDNDNEEEEHISALVHVKHSLSSDEHDNTNSSNSSEWVANEHAQSNASHAQEKMGSELQSQCGTDELKPKVVIQVNSVPRVCTIPPKKRRRMVTEMSKSSEPGEYSGDTDVTSVDIKPAPIDFDDAFLQGLRPEMNHMNFHQKLYFKRRVYELLGEIIEGGEGGGNNSQPQMNGHLGVNLQNLPNLSNHSAPPLQHLGLLARTGTLQLPKLAPKPSKDF